MKVCTDSCILGAYTPVAQAQNILDIGTGTGLLALMVAQRSAAQITAIEIDAAAAAQAQENINNSSWANQINVYQQSLQEFAGHNNQLFDLIICNPPFYAASHLSPDKARNVAMHSQELSLAEIASFCRQFLSATGQLYILLPPTESKHFASLAHAENLNLVAALHIYTTTKGKHIRTIQGFSRTPIRDFKEENLFIRNPNHTFTPAFQALLRDYYLIF